MIALSGFGAVGVRSFSVSDHVMYVYGKYHLRQGLFFEMFRSYGQRAEYYSVL
jgi:hypothetical protein